MPRREASSASMFPEDALALENDNPSGSGAGVVVGSSSSASSNAGWVDVDAILGEMCGPVPLSSSSSSSGDHRGASDDSHMMTATAAYLVSSQTRKVTCSVLIKKKCDWI